MEGKYWYQQHIGWWRTGISSVGLQQEPRWLKKNAELIIPGHDNLVINRLPGKE
jgi:hypothetical protein